jgi:hypothetical protein
MNISLVHIDNTSKNYRIGIEKAVRLLTVLVRTFIQYQCTQETFSKISISSRLKTFDRQGVNIKFNHPSLLKKLERPYQLVAIQTGEKTAPV